MGKKSDYMMDDGRKMKSLHPIEAEKRAKKKQMVRKSEEERRKKKFKDMLGNEPESIKRKVMALERQDKLGTLSVRQRIEKNEMRELLNEHEKHHGEVTLTDRRNKGEAEPEAASEEAALQPAPVAMQWNQYQAMSMVPSSILRKRNAAAQAERQRQADVIPGSNVTASTLASAIAPVAEPVVQQAAPRAAPASFRSINLVPDVDDDDADDDDVEEDPAFLPPSGSSSLLFSSGRAFRPEPAPAAAPAAAPVAPAAPAAAPAPAVKEPPSADTEYDNEFAQFLADVGGA